MKRRLRMVGSAVMGLLMMTAGAAQADAPATDAGPFALKGVGQRSCATFVEARTAGSPLYVQFGSWMSGYLSAYNRYMPETVDIAPWQSMDLLAAYLTNYCVAHPESTVFEAVDQLTGVLHPDRVRDPTEVVTIRGGGDSVDIYTVVIGQIQTALAERGHYGGDIDHVFGPVTRQALEQFQSEHNLAVSGIPDQRTVYKLLHQQ